MIGKFPVLVFLLVSLAVFSMSATAQSPSDTGFDASTSAEEAEVNPEDPAPPTSDANAMKLINQARKILGGADAMRAIKSLHAEGTFHLGRKPYPFIMVWEAPARFRFDYEEAMRYGKQGRIIRATDGTTAWSRDDTVEESEASALPQNENRAFNRSNRLFGPLLDFEDRGIKFTYEGQGKTRGRPVYMVKIYYPDGAREWMYFDRTNGMPILHSREEVFAAALRLVDHIFLDYQKVAGVYIPVRIDKVIRNEKIGSIEIESIQANRKVEPHYFSPPQTQKKEIWLRQNPR